MLALFLRVVDFIKQIQELRRLVSQKVKPRAKLRAKLRANLRAKLKLKQKNLIRSDVGAFQP